MTIFVYFLWNFEQTISMEGGIIMRKMGLLPRLMIAIILGIIIGRFGPAWIVRILATFNGLFGNFWFAIPLI